MHIIAISHKSTLFVKRDDQNYVLMAPSSGCPAKIQSNQAMNSQNYV